MTRLWTHWRTLWPGWGILLPLPYVAFAIRAALMNGFHWEHATILAAVFSLFSFERTKKLFLGAYPCGLLACVYDGMRLVKNVGLTEANVHDCDLRAHELSLFHVTDNGVRETLQDYFQTHHWAWLDLVCSAPYGTFIFACLGCAVVLYFRDYPRMVRFTWCFLAMNLLGFVTYHVYPAAPPWYYHAHGCTVDLAAHASEGAGLARVDAMLGIDYFAGLYGRSSDIFGAMPSLHCGYACIVMLEGWAAFRRLGRAASVAFFSVMCFAAVYLDHHWVLDCLAGILYCLVTVGVARAWTRWRATAGAKEPVPILDETSATSGAP